MRRRAHPLVERFDARAQFQFADERFGHGHERVVPRYSRHAPQPVVHLRVRNASALIVQIQYGLEHLPVNRVEKWSGDSRCMTVSTVCGCFNKMPMTRRSASTSAKPGCRPRLSRHIHRRTSPSSAGPRRDRWSGTRAALGEPSLRCGSAVARACRLRCKSATVRTPSLYQLRSTASR